ncbi:hypothetical protein ACE103_29720 [Bradyrhizobium sp. ma5]|uniref:hypothetical protein n=1 Tax=Bradyrhizobium sp. ma5 TaxID=3344828 RepID=UPI0035D40E10
MAKKTRKAKKRPETHLVENVKKLAVSSQAVLLLELGKLYKKAKPTRPGLLNKEAGQSSTLRKRAIKKSRARPTAKYRSKKGKSIATAS